MKHRPDLAILGAGILGLGPAPGGAFAQRLRWRGMKLGFTTRKTPPMLDFLGARAAAQSYRPDARRAAVMERDSPRDVEDAAMRALGVSANANTGKRP